MIIKKSPSINEGAQWRRRVLPPGPTVIEKEHYMLFPLLTAREGLPKILCSSAADHNFSRYGLAVRLPHHIRLFNVRPAFQRQVCGGRPQLNEVTFLSRVSWLPILTKPWASSACIPSLRLRCRICFVPVLCCYRGKLRAFAAPPLYVLANARLLLWPTMPRWSDAWSQFWFGFHYRSFAFSHLY